MLCSLALMRSERLAPDSVRRHAHLGPDSNLAPFVLVPNRVIGQRCDMMTMAPLFFGHAGNVDVEVREMHLLENVYPQMPYLNVHTLQLISRTFQSVQ